MIVGSLGLLLALQHGDSASGGFAFSQGLEASCSMAERLGPFDFASYLHHQIVHRWADAGRVALLRAHRLRGNIKRLAGLDRPDS